MHLPRQGAPVLLSFGDLAWLCSWQFLVCLSQLDAHVWSLSHPSWCFGVSRSDESDALASLPKFYDPAVRRAVLSTLAQNHGVLEEAKSVAALIQSMKKLEEVRHLTTHP